jgi:DNA-binding transcriptional regulator YiaG
MTAKQYRRALAELELSQAKMADYLGVSLRTSQNWALAQAPIHPCAAILLRLLMDGKISLDDLR